MHLYIDDKGTCHSQRLFCQNFGGSLSISQRANVRVKLKVNEKIRIMRGQTNHLSRDTAQNEVVIATGNMIDICRKTGRGWWKDCEV